MLFDITNYIFWNKIEWTVILISKGSIEENAF